MDYLLSTLENCSNKKFVSQKQHGEILDVTIKLVRVVANMSVNNEVGYGLGLKKSLGSILLTLLLAVNNCKVKLVCSVVIVRRDDCLIIKSYFSLQKWKNYY